jgi:hypothetical protein
MDSRELNEEMITKHKDPDIVNITKIRRLEWLRHVVRMNETRSVKKIFEGKLEGRRGRRRPVNTIAFGTNGIKI